MMMSTASTHPLFLRPLTVNVQEMRTHSGHVWPQTFHGIIPVSLLFYRYIEIYNDVPYDLLNAASGGNAKLVKMHAGPPTRMCSRTLMAVCPLEARQPLLPFDLC